MTPPSGRWVALQALLLMEGGNLGAAEALERALAEAGVDPSARSEALSRERGLALELTLGVLRWELRLNAIASRMAKKGGAQRMHPAVRLLLNLGLYQLMFLDRIPARAAVAETVALTRPAGVGFASGFVNAALRRFTREGEALSEPRGKGRAALAERTSHPAWFVDAMAPVLGEDLPALLEAGQARPPLTLRVNRVVAMPEAVIAALEGRGITVIPGRYSPDALTVSGPVGDPAELPGFGEGWFTVQDEASQVVGLLASPQAGMTALDACAAPGGKATHLAAQIGPSGRVWAVDVSPRRLAPMVEASSRLGAVGLLPRLYAWGQEAPAPSEGFIPLAAGEAESVDLALVDAPCSAMGIVRRIPEVKRRRDRADIDRQAARQQEILDAVAPRVKPGGALVYSVCSPLPQEGEAVVAAFLSRHPEFEREDPRLGPEAPWHALVGEDGAVRTYPHRHGCDAFYAARLRRRGR